MPDSMLYLLKANLAILLFYLGYRLLLRKLTFYTLNRFYLLFALLFSFTYPLVELAGLFEAPIQQLPGEAVYLIPNWEQVPAAEFNGWPLLVGVVALGAVWFAVRFAIRLLSLWRVHGQSRAATWRWIHYRQVFAPIRPFSFWRNIYVNVHSHADGELTEIFKHEQVHVKELHTLDVLLAELSSVLCWFNPGMWLLRNAIRENLEFITDRNVLRSGIDRQAYQYSLLGAGRQLETHPTIAQGFNFKNLKTRIMMMNKKRSSCLHLGRYLLSVPVIAVLVLFITMSRAAYLPEILDSPAVPARVAGMAQPTVETAMPQTDAIADTTKAKQKISIDQIIGELPETGDAPLVILDGLELKKGFDMKTLDADAIASISVLKDAAATALYGNRGARGVVLITTKTKASKDAAHIDTAALPEIRGGSKGPEEKPKTPSAADHDFDGALIVIDGEASTSAALRKLAPDDIEAITVLKGASATDKYGDKGKKGAIEVTTKSP
ncbi:M56 family metallopeptidase [Parapedobacter sp.]